MNKEYETGFALGTIKGEEDSKLLVSPYPYIEEGSEIYQEGYKNGYFIRYTQGLSYTLKEKPNEEIKEIISIRLDEINNMMLKESKKHK